MSPPEIQVPHYTTYLASDCAAFRKVKEGYGGFSNMAPYPLCVEGVPIRTSEALFQACKYPLMPELQQKIIDQRSPMACKMVQKWAMNEKLFRPDWPDISLKVMEWCVRVKLAQHWEDFGDLLLSTEERDIVEDSFRDTFWGAVPSGSGLLIGTNHLGVILTRIRDELRAAGSERMKEVAPLPYSDFLLLGTPIGSLTAIDS